jgi:hypothetical protein
VLQVAQAGRRQTHTDTDRHTHTTTHKAIKSKVQLEHIDTCYEMALKSFMIPPVVLNYLVQVCPSHAKVYVFLCLKQMLNYLYCGRCSTLNMMNCMIGAHQLPMQDPQVWYTNFTRLANKLNNAHGFLRCHRRLSLLIASLDRGLAFCRCDFL